MKLDVTPLRSAVHQLEKSIAYLNSSPAQEDPDLREQFRAACIQAFEYTYELANKFVTRQLEQIEANPAEVRQMEFMPKMRLAAEAGIVSDATRWHAYRELRGRTSHTYDSEEAEAVVEELDDFLVEVRKVLANLENLNRA